MAVSNSSCASSTIEVSSSSTGAVTFAAVLALVAFFGAVFFAAALGASFLGAAFLASGFTAALSFALETVAMIILIIWARFKPLSSR